MPRTVNFSDQNERRAKQEPPQTSGTKSFFGIRIGDRNTPKVATKTPVTPVEEIAMVAPIVEIPTSATVDAPYEAATEIVAESETVSDLTLLADQIIAKSVPEEIIGQDGNVDFETLFQAAQIPNVTVSADQAIHILNSIPKELPLSVKRLLVKTSLNLVSDLVQETTVSPNIVNDAAQKMLWVARLHENVQSEIMTCRENTRAEIAMLEAEIENKNRMLAEAEARAKAAICNCQSLTNKLHNVTLFFSHNDSEGDPTSQTTLSSPITSNDEPEELPSHLRDESVRRLLGLEDDSLNTTSSPPSEQRNSKLQYA